LVQTEREREREREKERVDSQNSRERRSSSDFGFRRDFFIARKILYPPEEDLRKETCRPSVWSNKDASHATLKSLFVME
jgi:hypothetical protein